jgi:hypothetical protein
MAVGAVDGLNVNNKYVSFFDVGFVTASLSRSSGGQCKNHFSPVLPDIRKRIILFGGFRSWLSCPTDTSSIKMKMSVGHWWNYTDKGKLNYSEKNLFQCHFVCHKYHMDSGPAQ